MYRTLVAFALSSTALICPAMAMAAEDQSTSPNTGLDEIIVTAQRREQNVINVPLSITAITGQALKNTGIQTISDMRFQIPGFISQSGTGYTQLFIRGIGNSIYVGADPSVATFVDDVPRPYGSLVDNFINVSRVEVLKGAQGGLYGRNATGGVINIISLQPTDELEMRGRLSFGDYQTVEAAAYVNVPINENIAVNISGTRIIHDPYVTNIARINPYPEGTTSYFGDPNSPVQVGEINNADFYAVDSKVRFQLGENFRLTVGGDYSQKWDSDGNGWVQRDPDRNYLVYLGLAAQGGISNPIPKWPEVPQRSVYDAVGSYSHTVDYGFSANAVWSLKAVDLTSITAFRWNNSNFRGDLGAAPVPMAGFLTDFNRNFFYQEFRAVSTGVGPLRFLGGATYFTDKVDSYIATLFLGFQLPGPTESTIKTDNFSVYGEVSYDFTERLTLTGSLRYVDEVKKANFPAQAGFEPQDAKTSQSKLVPSATLNYQMDDGIIYARYARGSKTGGVNPIVHPEAFGDAPGSLFGPETVDTFEVGYRATLFDNHVQFTSAIFYNAYKGLQIARAGNANNPQVTNAILNAGTARTYGAEAAVTWRVASPLTISANLGYLNARYKNAGYPGSPVVDPFTADGNLMALAPKWQGGISAYYNQPVNDALRIKANILYSYIGEYNHQYEEDPLLIQKSYSLVNMRVGVANIEDNVNLSLFVNNLFNEYYTIFATKNAIGVLTTEGPPRVIGATLQFEF